MKSCLCSEIGGCIFEIDGGAVRQEKQVDMTTSFLLKQYSGRFAC